MSTGSAYSGGASRIAFGMLTVSVLCWSQTDPGPRTGAAAAGAPISGLTLKEGKFFTSGLVSERLV